MECVSVGREAGALAGVLAEFWQNTNRKAQRENGDVVHEGVTEAELRLSFKKFLSLN